MTFQHSKQKSITDSTQKNRMKKFYLLLLAAHGSWLAASSQNVGIGTTNPLNKLHVAGGFRLDTLTGVGGNGILTHNGNGVVYGIKLTGNVSDVLRGDGTFGAANAATNAWSLTGNSGINPATNFIGTTDGQPLLFRVKNQPSGIIDSVLNSTAFGYKALVSNLGVSNTAIGMEALYSNTYGGGNTAIGLEALRLNTEGSANSADGEFALILNTTGHANTATGWGALGSNITGNYNVAVGYGASGDSHGDQNVAIGANALFNNNSGSNITAIGYGADVLTDGLTNATAIGYNAQVSQSNSLVLGNSDVNVGIGTTSPNTSSLLDLTSNSKGLLIPRMTATERNAISSPATGLLVYDNSVNSFYFYNGGSWNQIGGTSANVWSLNGNAGTDPTTNFIGTTDAEPLLFRVHNIIAGQIQTTNANTGFGLQTLSSNTTGFQNTAYGDVALPANTTGNYNTAIGVNALYSNTTGNDNTANGASALQFNTTGDNNTATGHYTLYGNTTGSGNTGDGLQALFDNTSGYNNVAIGFNALISNTTGYYNSGNGLGALYLNATGNFNTGMGAYALERTTASQYNTAIGYLAGSARDNGDNNVFVGSSADVGGDGFSNVIAIGQGTICTASNQVTIGNPTTNSYMAYADWTNISDGRYKRNVKEDVPGLAFISKLRPVTYNLDATGIDNFLHKNQAKDKQMSGNAKSKIDEALKENEQIRHTGFVAQEVEKSAKELGFNFSGVDAPKNQNDVYGLRYSEFVVPLVKAVQEQQAIIEKQQHQIDDLKKELEGIKAKSK